jgi:hypothetical protein
MKWIKTSNFLPLYYNIIPTVGELISFKDYLVLLPCGWGWEKKVVAAVFKLDEDGKIYLHHWKDKSNNLYDATAPLYWCQIDYPEDAAEVLSDWQDEILDRNFDQK